MYEMFQKIYFQNDRLATCPGLPYGSWDSPPPRVGLIKISGREWMDGWINLLVSDLKK